MKKIAQVLHVIVTLKRKFFTLSILLNSFYQLKHIFSQVIQRLWYVPPRMTYLGKKLAETMTDASRECDLSNCTLNTIFAQSLWPVEVYAGFHHDTLSISCVFEKVKFQFVYSVHSTNGITTNHILYSIRY